MRAHCGRLMVKPSLSGAHLHFPSEKLAVRVYYPIDIRALEQEYHAMNGTKDIISIIQEPMSDKDDLDGLVAFSKMFALSLVLFVLPDTHFNEQLGRVDSFTFRAQRLLETTNTRVLPVTSTQMAIDRYVRLGAKSKECTVCTPSVFSLTTSSFFCHVFVL